MTVVVNLLRFIYRSVHMPQKTSTRRGNGGRNRVSSGKKSKTKKKTTRSASRAPSRKTKRSRRPLLRGLIDFRSRISGFLGRQADDVWGVVFLVIAIIIGLAYISEAGPVGRFLAGSLELLFGIWRFVIPFGLAALALTLVVGKPRNGIGRIVAGGILAFVGAVAMFHLLVGNTAFALGTEAIKARGGAVGALIAFPLWRILGTWGAFVILAALCGVGVLLVTRTTVSEFAQALAQMGRDVRAYVSDLFRRPVPEPSTKKPRHVRPVVEETQKPQDTTDETALEIVDAKAEKPAKPKKTESPVQNPDGYTLPPMDILGFGGGGSQDKRVLEQTAEDLEETLRQHGVEASLTRIVPGPTVTRFEIELAPGVKVNRISSLSGDIAYALATPDIRLLVPIPGKSAIGVEVPNRRRRRVTLGDILRSDSARADTDPLSIGLGMDIAGHPKFLNLSELPHVLIAGATGAGKSSCINSIVSSILMRAHPDDVRLIMVDPKRVELGQYNGVPHLLTRVITNPKKANDALKWAVAEMDRRYDLLADAKVRDIDGYREKWAAGDLDPDGFDRFPYIVVLIDELNDLMMVAGKEVEDSIVRIAQMARAVGIHLVIATQRPSVNVITGVIKANVPSRLAFSVASQTDSRVIIDGSGAEKLVGMGDMLVVTAKEPRPARIQGAWVEESEVHRIVSWVKDQRDARYRDEEVMETVQAVDAAKAAKEDDEDEQLVTQAIDLVVRSQMGSTSMLQRKLRIGFARAGRVMDILEMRGIVGPSVGSKAREVLITEEQLEEVLTPAEV
ncbi:MAG: DNA translocase FtsK [Acidimicrobiia bacterium]|nr:DNA translocase FtsK [Acidimicrobiia bacterium]